MSWSSKLFKRIGWSNASKAFNTSVKSSIDNSFFSREDVIVYNALDMADVVYLTG